MGSGIADLVGGLERPPRAKAGYLCACGSLDVVARGMCPRCLARQHHDKEYFGGYQEHVLTRDGWTCQGCFYRPSQQGSDIYSAGVVPGGLPAVGRLI